MTNFQINDTALWGDVGEVLVVSGVFDDRVAIHHPTLGLWVAETARLRPLPPPTPEEVVVAKAVAWANHNPTRTFGLRSQLSPFGQALFDAVQALEGTE